MTERFVRRRRKIDLPDEVDSHLHMAQLIDLLNPVPEESFPYLVRCVRIFEEKFCMTLRDKFAASVVCGGIAGIVSKVISPDELARVGYQAADAMLRIRTKELETKC
jgi:hypothetical protein